jgi:hypothetical protein
VHILNDPAVLKKVEAEARGWKGGSTAEVSENRPRYDTQELPYISTCLKEVLRMYIAIENPRKV